MRNNGKLLGLNIDHVATIRNARGEHHPDPIKAAQIAIDNGVDIITFHLREDRRHIRDKDIFNLKRNINIPLNMEMAATNEMLEIALKLQPEYVCIVPEKREEITTEGGLNLFENNHKLQNIIQQLQSDNIKVSLFINPDLKIIDQAAALKADIIEMHTGAYANQTDKKEINVEFNRIKNATEYATNSGLEVHAGHGLDFDNVTKLVKLPGIRIFHIGHFLIGESIFDGLGSVIRKMRGIINH